MAEAFALVLAALVHLLAAFAARVVLVLAVLDRARHEFRLAAAVALCGFKKK